MANVNWQKNGEIHLLNTWRIGDHFTWVSVDRSGTNCIHRSYLFKVLPWGHIGTTANNRNRRLWHERKAQLVNSLVWETWRRGTISLFFGKKDTIAKKEWIYLLQLVFFCRKKKLRAPNVCCLSPIACNWCLPRPTYVRERNLHLEATPPNYPFLRTWIGSDRNCRLFFSPSHFHSAGGEKI